MNSPPVCSASFFQPAWPAVFVRASPAALDGVQLAVAPFEDVLNHAKPGDFVYFDPPYQPVSETAHFTDYHCEGFDEGRQKKLAETVRTLAKRGCRVLLSNSDTPLVHKLYRGFAIERVPARRAINSVAAKRGPVAEALVGNY